MSAFDRLDALDDAFDADPLSEGVNLRFDLADIVIGALAAQKMSQRTLAEKAGMQEAYISRIVHGRANCQFDVAGRILFALGLKGQLIAHHGKRTDPFGAVLNTVAWGPDLLGKLLKEQTAHGQISKVFEGCTGSYVAADSGQVSVSGAETRGTRQAARRP